MSKAPDLDGIEGRYVKENPFHGFQIKDVLIEFDFPRVFVAVSPDKTNWLFKWCDSLEDIAGERWLAFPVSDAWLNALKANSVSLREVMSLAKGDLYISDSSEVFKPKEVKVTGYDALPTNYVPEDDVTVNGTIIGSGERRPEQFALRLHVFSEKSMPEGRVPLSIVSPLQQRFQNFMSFTAHNIVGQGLHAGYSPEDWSALNVARVAQGSYKIECTTSSNEAQSERLAEACQLLCKLLGGNLDFNSISEKIGNDGLLYAWAVAKLVSEFELSISVKWATEKDPNGYLAIDKRRADKLLEMLSISQEKPTLTSTTVTIRINENQFEPAQSFTLQLTDTEAEPIRRPVRGQGGMQSLLRAFQAKLGDDNQITLTRAEVERVLRYGQNYGQGGFQGRLTGLARALRRVGVALNEF